MRSAKLLLTGLIAGATFLVSATPPPLPFKIIDAHSHLVTTDKVKYPQVPADASGATGTLPGMGFRQFGDGRPVPEAEAMAGWMDAQGVEGLVAVQKRGAYGLDNSYILDSADRYPDRYFPVAVVNAEDPATAGLVTTWATTRHLAGIRFTGVMGNDGTFPWLASDKALVTWRAATANKVAVEIMTQPFGRPEKAIAVYDRLADEFPSTTIVLDHLGWPDAVGAPTFGLTRELAHLGRHKNVYYKFTTINMDKLQDKGIDPAAFLKQAVRIFGADHIMWGSDSGNSPGTYPQMVQRAVAATRLLTPTQRHLVLRDTARQVFARHRLE